MSNHASYLDPAAVGVSIKRRCLFMAKEDLFHVPLLKVFVSSFAFPVRRGRPQPSTIKEAVRRIKGGNVLVMFPQGTRSAAEEGFDIKRGVDLIARMSGAVVVPVLVTGTDRALPVGAILPRPAKITVSFGRPIRVGEAGDSLKGDSVPGISGAVAVALKELKEERRES